MMNYVLHRQLIDNQRWVQRPRTVKSDTAAATLPPAVAARGMLVAGLTCCLLPISHHCARMRMLVASLHIYCASVVGRCALLARARGVQEEWGPGFRRALRAQYGRMACNLCNHEAVLAQRERRLLLADGTGGTAGVGQHIGTEHLTEAAKEKEKGAAGAGAPEREL